MRYGIALGSNLGDRLGNLRRGVQEMLVRIEDCALLATASVYETEPVDCPPDSPGFYNTVIEIECTRPPHAVQRVLQSIEQALGRPEQQERNAPRTLDLDILYADDMRIDDDVLTLPHPRLHLRRFVLQPLSDIRPGLMLPGQEQSIADLLAALPDDPGSVSLVGPLT
jgi:2-amino-4-hydroxy-6-hydroxymethyldihydropteridine diphosphokinase